MVKSFHTFFTDSHEFPNLVITWSEHPSLAPTALIPPLRPDRCTTHAAVDFEAFVLIGNIIQSKTAAVFSGGGVRNTAATSSKHVKDQTSLESGQ